MIATFDVLMGVSLTCHEFCIVFSYMKLGQINMFESESLFHSIIPRTKTRFHQCRMICEYKVRFITTILDNYAMQAHLR